MFLRRLSLFSLLCPFLFQVCVPLFTMRLTMLTLVASVFTLTLRGTAVPERARGSTVMSTPGRIIQRQKQARFISFKRTEEHAGRRAPLKKKNKPKKTTPILQEKQANTHTDSQIWQLELFSSYLPASAFHSASIRHAYICGN